MIIRARTVLSLSRPPIGDGAVVVAGNRIQAVGPWRELRSGSRRRVVDLPGLVSVGVEWFVPPPDARWWGRRSASPFNPNGIPSSSPGLAPRPYPGKPPPIIHQR